MIVKRLDDCIATFNLKLRGHVDVDRLQKAWEHVSRSKAPILRCRVVDLLTENSLVQVHVNVAIQWDKCQNFKEYFQKFSRIYENLSQPLTRLTMIHSAGGDDVGMRSCLPTQHHAIYDGYSLKLLIDEVSKAYLHSLEPVSNKLLPTAP